jgi:cytochrome b involved in lipid metabolism
LKKTFFLLASVLLLIGAGCGGDNSNGTSTTTPINQSGQTVTLTPSEVAKHTSSNDCWMIVSGSVYNVTSYLPIHPGGASEIQPFCGKDGTNAFATQGGRGSHSGQAQNDLSSLLLGMLGATVTL